jgi:hypothetical protein
MTKKIRYTNCKGDVYFVRCVDGKKGKRFVCSKKESADDLISLPDGFEFSENPNGKVCCRRKLNSLIKSDEMELAGKLTARLAAPDLIKCEQKKNEIIIYSHRRFPDLGKLMPVPNKSEHEVRSFLAEIVRYEPVLKFQLTDDTIRMFTAYRMTWQGKSDWMYLSMGSLNDLIEKYAPHIEKSSFFELVD